MDEICRHQRERCCGQALRVTETLGLGAREESPVIWLNQLHLMGYVLVFMQLSTPAAVPGVLIYSVVSVL